MRTAGAFRDRMLSEERVPRVCAWCHQPLDVESADGPVSHGICASCASFVLADKRSLSSFLNTIDAPLLAVDEDVRTLAANGLALQALGKRIAQVEGRRGGDVMECQYSRLPEGCGRTIHCSGCQIRRSVNYTRETGEPLLRVKAYMSIQTPQGIRNYDYFVSTERLDAGVVLLRIDDTRPAS